MLRTFAQRLPVDQTKMTVALAPHLRRAGLATTIAGLVAISLATLWPELPGPVESHLCLICGSFGTVDALLNIALFVPLGLGLALSGVPAKRALVAMCVLSVLIETAQFLVIPGRDATIGDVLTNTMGGALGYAIGHYPRLWLGPSPRTARVLAPGWAMIWLIVQIVSSIGFTVSIPRSVYYGQIARTLGSFAVFPGQVLSARIENVWLSDAVVADSRQLQQLLVQGATIVVSVVPANPTRGIAPIVRVADAEQRQMLLLAQDGDNLIFGVHTGADALRLRSPLFALAGVFPDETSRLSTVNKSLRVSGRYGAREVRLQSQVASGNRDFRFEPTASMGWIQWLPFQWFITGTTAEHVLSWLWIGLLVLPLGYWSPQMQDLSRLGRSQWERTRAPLFGLVTVLTGLVFIPKAFDLPPVPLGDWSATLGCLLIGLRLARHPLEQRLRNTDPEPTRSSR